MEVGDIVEIKSNDERNKTFTKNRKYEVLKIYPKKTYEQDLILCKDLKNSCKECFQRFDLIERPKIRRKMVDRTELKNKITDMFKNGLDRVEIVNRLVADKENMSRSGLKYIVSKVEFGLGYKPQKSKSRKIEQLDENGNVIRTFNSVVEAANELCYSSVGIRDICIGRVKKSRYNLRFAEVQDDKQ